MANMMPLANPPNGVLSVRRCSLSSPSSLNFTTPYPSLFSNRKPRLIPTGDIARPLNLALAKADGTLDSSNQPLNGSPASSSSFSADQTVFVGDGNVPLEGVIQFDKPDSSSRFRKWGRVALLAGGDVLALLLFSAIGRFSHGFSVFDIETLRTADPFVAGWFLSAYFLGGYGEDGRGMNGLTKAVMATTKSWALGIPFYVTIWITVWIFSTVIFLNMNLLGILIRATTSGHLPQFNFIAVTMGSTAVLLIGWRTGLYNLLPCNTSSKGDVYRRGSPFELFELLTSLVRRW